MSLEPLSFSYMVYTEASDGKDQLETVWEKIAVLPNPTADLDVSAYTVKNKKTV